MARLANSFDGGTDGVDVTTANSGGISGDAFDDSSISGGNSIVFDDDGALLVGAMAAHCQAAASGTAFLQWSDSWADKTTTYWRMYFSVDDPTPSNHTEVIRVRNGTANVFNLQLRTNGVLALRDASFTLRYSSETVIEAGEVYRLELRIDHSATTGHMLARLFAGANIHGDTPDEEFGSATSNWNTGASADNIWFGINSNPGQALNMWLDEVAIDDTDWIGSAVTEQPSGDATIVTEPADVTVDAPASFTSISRTIVTEPADVGYDGPDASVSTTSVSVPATIVTEPADVLTGGPAATLSVGITLSSGPADIIAGDGPDTTVDADAQPPTPTGGKLLLLGVG